MRENLGFALEGAWQVLAIGLILGAGLPAVFALGVRSMAWGAGGAAEVAADARPHPAGRAVAGLCFLVVLAGIGAGLFVILSAGGIA